MSQHIQIEVTDYFFLSWSFICMQIENPAIQCLTVKPDRTHQKYVSEFFLMFVHAKIKMPQ